MEAEFSKKTEHELKGKSPTSLITFKQIHMATEMSLRDALILNIEWYKGVRHQVTL